MKRKVFELRINLDNEAFDILPCQEIARILQSLAIKLEHENIGNIKTRQSVADINGNTIGYFIVRSN